MKGVNMPLPAFCASLASPVGHRARSGQPQRGHQRGYAALTVGVVLLFLVSLISLYLTRSGIVDLRTSANKVRSSEALAMAEQRLEIGMAWMGLSTNRATLSNAAFSACNGANATSFGAAARLGASWLCLKPTADFVIATPSGTGQGTLYSVIGEGTSADGTANTVVKQGVFFRSGATNLPNTPPITAAGNVDIGGSFTLTPNPNAGGRGVAISIWSPAAVAFTDNGTGSAKTCHLGDYPNNCTSATAISEKGRKGPDIAELATDFPSDLFNFIFGVPRQQYSTVKGQAQVVTDCGGLSGATTGIVWYAGTGNRGCSIPSNTVVGSPDKPVLMVVESALFTLGSGSTFYGMVFAFAPTPGADGKFDAGDIKGAGNGEIRGVVVSNDTTTAGQVLNGTFNLVHDDTVMRSLALPGNTQFQVLGRTPGTWSDYLP